MMRLLPLVLALLAVVMVCASAFWVLKKRSELAGPSGPAVAEGALPPPGLLPEVVAPPPGSGPPRRDESPDTATPAGPAPPTPRYTQGRKSFDGTGRYYMGREIAYVMGHQAIDWLERSDREQEEAPSRAIAGLDLKPTDVIADIGAGSGYYTFRLAPRVPDGKVVAVDIQPEMIEFLENREKELGLSNVEAHLGTVEDTRLPPESIDAALMVDAYHEFSHPYEMMRSIFEALRPGGRVILLEYRAEDPRVPIKPLHKMTQEQVKKEMAVVGLKWKVTHDFLPWQHFMVFEKP